MKELPSFRNLVASRYPTDLFPAMLVSGEAWPVSLVYHTESFVVSHIPSPSRRVERREEGIGGAIWVHKWLGDFVGLAARNLCARVIARWGGTNVRREHSFPSTTRTLDLQGILKGNKIVVLLPFTHGHRFMGLNRGRREGEKRERTGSLMIP